MNKLTEKEWGPKDILITAIKLMYKSYTNRCMPSNMGLELQESVKELVTAYIRLFMDDAPKRKLAVDLIILIIEGACRKNGMGYSDSYRAEFYIWLIDLENENKFPTKLTEDES